MVRRFLEDLDGQVDMWHELAHTQGAYGASFKGSYGSSQAASGKKTSKFDRRTDRSGAGAFNDGRAAIEAMTNFMNMFMSSQINQARSSYQNRAHQNNFQNRFSNIEDKKLLQITSGNPSTSDSKDGPRLAKNDRLSDKRYGRNKKAYVVDENEKEHI